MLASSNVSISVLSQSFLKPETASQNVRRNYLLLFDQMQQECLKMDCSLGVSLVEREKERSLRERVTNVHPSIPKAKMGKEDQNAL